MEDTYLPTDVHMIILSHLPVKSLVQFKSVCKSWRSIIEDCDFIELHHRTTRNDNCVLTRDYGFCLLHWSETGHANCVNLDLPFFKEMDKVDIEVAVPCKGIICMSDGEQDIFLWNPAIRDFKLLPPTIIDYENCLCFCVGFGFDPNTNDYKVVRIWTPDDYRYRHQTFQVEVYSLNSDSWRSIESIPILTLFEPATAGQVFSNGKYYWLIEHSDQYQILCFDMVKEVFEIIELPESDNGNWDRLVVMKDSVSSEIFEVIEFPEGRSDNGRWVKLITMKNSLAMVSYTRPVNENCFFHIWLMKEDCGSRSWRKFFTIGPFFEDDSPLGFWKKDELLFKFECTKRIISYNNATQSVREIHQKLDVDEFLPLAIFNESLISLSRGCK